MTQWLLEGDPSLRWQVMRDLLDVPEDAWRAERLRVASDGDGARLLALAGQDGQWAGGSFVPEGFTPELWRQEGQPWTATTYCLTQLREFGLDPGMPRIREIVRLVGENSRWDHEGQRYWDGEVDTCINARTLADGSYFGLELTELTAWMLREQQPDGGWNCERENGSVRSSFDTTINAVEALLEVERSGQGGDEVSAARAAGEEYLLERSLLRRLSTGELVDREYLDLSYPRRWRYDVLRAADHLRSAAVRDGKAPDLRMQEAVEHIRSRRQEDGRWLLDSELRGRVWFTLDDGVGLPSRWVTLKALRVLKWWDAQHEAAASVAAPVS
ncbi:hypothetical protein [Arthrobacter sp. NPDC090010]|uniref:hypothetical protein n=1 Tax=Arthrobacter sp. NPDC090010 TaxID=3363942 RepID=UPI0038132224